VASVLDRYTKKNLRSYQGKNEFIEERLERTPQRRGGPSQEKHWGWNDEVQGFSRQDFYIFI